MCRCLLLLLVPRLLTAGGAEAAPTDERQHGTGCPDGMVRSERWKARDLVGFTLKIVDPESVLELSFGKRDVAMTAGRKGGWVTAPVFPWRIGKDGVVLIQEDGQVNYKLQKRCAGNHRFVVDVNGKRREFAVSKD